MRQAVEPSPAEAHDVDIDPVAGIADVLLHHGTDEAQILERTAQILADTLDYALVLIASLEEKQNLVLRAFALQVEDELAARIEPLLQEARDERRILARLGEAAPEEKVALRKLRATICEGQAEPIPLSERSSDLLDLFIRPLDQAASAHWQKASGVQRVTVQPFSLTDELCGCLVVASSRPNLGQQERRLLQTVAKHLALGMRNARLYERMEEQRRAAQAFAQMAFSGSAYLHTLRNQIGGLRTFLGLVQALPKMKPEQRDEVIVTSHKAMESLDQAAEILDHLHEPWRRQPKVVTDVNDCLTVALIKLFRDLTIQPGDTHLVTAQGINVQWRLANDLPTARTSPELLTEAFRIVMRNAVDALHEKFGAANLSQSWLTVESIGDDEGQIVVTIADNGAGIASGNLNHIFELGWSTKEGQGMGFGLFWTRNFVDGLGGTIAVESTEGAGSTFRLIIPSAVDDASRPV